MPIDVKRWAVRQLLAVVQRMPSPNLSSYLVNLLNGNSSLVREVRAILPGSYLRERSPANAMAAYNQNIQQYPNSELERDALYGKFLYALYSRGDLELSQQLYHLLQTRYPNSYELELAEVQLQNYHQGAMRPSSGAGLAKAPNTTSSQLPTEFNLSQNYPNPFNPTTTIKYGLPVDAHVTLKVYDVLGREVQTLVNGNVPAGVHTVRFDATDLSSGVYLYRLTAGEYTSVKKLVVMK